MTPEEKFMFDLEGYIVIKNVLTSQEIEALVAVVDREFPRDYSDGNDRKGRNGYRHAGNVSAWDPVCGNLIDHPKVTPYLAQLLGSKFRLDHDYCIFMDKGGKGGGLHGHQWERNHEYKYRDGEMRNGLCVAIFFFSDAKEGDGGFACIPGSHKTNFRDSLPREVRRFERIPHYVVQPPVKAGEVLIFTEALIHGTLSWKADHERRTFLYKYNPGHVMSAPDHYRLENYAHLTQQQKRILTPASIHDRPDSVSTLNS